MKSMRFIFPCLLLILGTGMSLGQAKPDEHPTVSQILDHSLKPVEAEFTGAAGAMPEDKYSFAPSNGEFKGVRTFAQQVKHVAAVNYIIGAAILEEKPPLELGSENGPDSITSKADIMNFLKQSFAYLHKAMASINEKNETDLIKNPFGEHKTTRLGFATVGFYHPFDHYGQMVEYLRMNGIVPPASRGQ
jgi:uncharacterized damage-inducible protein DinB